MNLIQVPIAIWGEKTCFLFLWKKKRYFRYFRINTVSELTRGYCLARRGALRNKNSDTLIKSQRMASEDIDYEEALITAKGYKAKEGFSK